MIGSQCPIVLTVSWEYGNFRLSPALRAAKVRQMRGSLNDAQIAVVENLNRHRHLFR
jgi:hypothetical protein